jgi:PPM family protein phosphatase
MKYKLFLPLAFKKAGTCNKQEDTIYPLLDDATAEDRLFVVCNGTGGHGFGDIASRTVCKGLTKSILANFTYDRPFTDTLLNKAIESTYGLLANCKVNPEQKTGSTFAALLFHRGGCMAAHIGNTIIYQLRPLSNEIIYCSNNQSGNNISKDSSSESGRLLQPNQEQHLKPEIEFLKDIHHNDYFFICTKGTMENMSEGELMGILADETTTDKEKRDIIIERTEDNKSSHSAYLIRMEKVIHEDIDMTSQSVEKPTDHQVVKVPSQKTDDHHEESSSVKHEKKNVTIDNDNDQLSNWSLNSDKENSSYVKYIVSGIIAFAFVGVLIYFMFAKSSANNDAEPNIEMSTKPAPTDTIATTRQPAASPDTTDVAQQPTEDSTKIKAVMAKKAYFQKMKAAKAAALAAQNAATKEQSTTKPTPTEKPATVHTETATEKNATQTSTPATQSATPKE